MLPMEQQPHRLPTRIFGTMRARQRWHIQKHTLTHTHQPSTENRITILCGDGWMLWARSNYHGFDSAFRALNDNPISYVLNCGRLKCCHSCIPNKIPSRIWILVSYDFRLWTRHFQSVVNLSIGIEINCMFGPIWNTQFESVVENGMSTLLLPRLRSSTNVCVWVFVLKQKNQPQIDSCVNLWCCVRLYNFRLCIFFS